MPSLSFAPVVALALAGAVTGCSVLYSTDAISSQPSDGGGSGADSGPGGPSLCDASAFVFCDGFEDGLGATPIAHGGGTPAVDSTHVYRGKYALGSALPATDAGAIMSAEVQEGQAWPAHVFIRLFALLPLPLAPQGAGLLSYVDATNAGIVLYVPGNNAEIFVSSFGVPNAATVQSSTRAPLGDWVCFEMEVDSVAHLVNVWMNDDPLGDLSTMASVGTLNVLSVGLSYNGAPAGPAYQAWFDEIAVDTKHIGCAR